MRVWKDTSIVKVINIACANSGTGHTQGTCGAVFWIPANRIHLSSRIIVHASILLEINTGSHRSACCICTMTGGKEHGRTQKRAGAAPEEFTAGIIENRQAYKGVFEILHKVSCDGIGGANRNRQ